MATVWSRKTPRTVRFFPAAPIGTPVPVRAVMGATPWWLNIPPVYLPSPHGSPSNRRDNGPVSPTTPERDLTTLLQAVVFVWFCVLAPSRLPWLENSRLLRPLVPRLVAREQGPSLPPIWLITSARNLRRWFICAGLLRRKHGWEISPEQNPTSALENLTARTRVESLCKLSCAGAN